MRYIKNTISIIICFLFWCHCSKASTPSTAELLEKLTNTDSPDYIVAVEWCGLLKIKEAVPLLERILEKKTTRYSLTVEIIKALGKIGDPCAIGILLRCLPDTDAISALNRIDPGWRFREETINYYTQLLDDFYKDATNECGRRSTNFKALLMMDYDEQRVKELCLEALAQKETYLTRDAVDKLVKLKANEAIEPLLDLLTELHPNIDRYLQALDTLAPEWRQTERGKEIGEMMAQEFKKRKAEFDKHIIDPDYAKIYQDLKELQDSESNADIPPHLAFDIYKGSRELKDSLERLAQTQVTAAIPLLLQIFQDEKEMLFLRCEAAESLGEIIEPTDSNAIALLIEKVGQVQPHLRFTSARALNRFGERFPEAISTIPQKDKIVDEFVFMLKNPDKDNWVLKDIISGLGIWGDNRMADDLLEVLDKKLYPDLWSTLRIADALSNLKDPRILDTLVRLYNQAGEYEKGSYMKILGNLKDRRALPLLQKALHDKNRVVRAYAEWGIYHITKE